MAAEVSLEFMTGNPQLGVISGRLTYLDNSTAKSDDKNQTGGTGTTRNAPHQQKDDNDDKQASNKSNADSDPHTTTASSCGDDGLQLPKRRSTLLCVLSVPAHMVPTDMLQFTAPFKEHVHSVRILRPCNPVRPSDPARTPAEYMVLLQMESQNTADDFFVQYNGKRFNSFETASCRIVFVAAATFDLSTGGGVTTIASPAFESPNSLAGIGPSGGGGSDSPRTPPLRSAVRFSPVSRHSGKVTGGVVVAASGMGLSPSPGATTWEYDASTCVICMERMESHVLTTVCNHTFHVECLTKWQDSPCPVCRFHHNNASEASTCQECQATDNLWVCLICGNVFCGSRHEDHIRGHYTSTLHAYAIEIETQQVWDFAGDGFVHRLIRNKADGKLVEISDPGQTSEERPQMPARLSDVQEERLVHGKLEGLAYQYNTLLTSQLDEQRHFYQKQLDGLLEQQENSRRERRARMVSGSDLIGALRQRRRELEGKCTSGLARLRKIREEAAFLWELNRSLETNKEQWSASQEQAQRDLESARKAREEWVPKLEAKVAQLMLKLDAGAAAAAAAVAAAEAAAGVATKAAEKVAAEATSASSAAAAAVAGGDQRDGDDISDSASCGDKRGGSGSNSSGSGGSSSSSSGATESFGDRSGPGGGGDNGSGTDVAGSDSGSAVGEGALETLAAAAALAPSAPLMMPSMSAREIPAAVGAAEAKGEKCESVGHRAETGRAEGVVVVVGRGDEREVAVVVEGKEDGSAGIEAERRGYSASSGHTGSGKKKGRRRKSK